MKRGFVAIKKNNANCLVPKFSECLLEFFNKDGNELSVNFFAENGKLVLEESKQGFQLNHSPECPIKMIAKTESGKDEMAQIEQNLGNENHIAIATSVVIESADNHILLTKRAHKLRASPNVWVTPGGYIEYDETVFKAGIREVEEETGLDISNIKMEVLGLWENVYPLLLGIGPPKTHVLIVYTHVVLDEGHESLTTKIKPNPDEVESYCWLSNAVVTKLFDFVSVPQPHGNQFYVVDDKLVSVKLDYSTMFNSWLWCQPQSYTGVNFALRSWLKKTKADNKTSKF